jgi:hypothetical protein
VETLEHLLNLIPRPLRVVFPATLNFGKSGWKLLHEIQPLPSFDFSAAAMASLPSWEVTLYRLVRSVMPYVLTFFDRLRFLISVITSPH